jgi:excisionase family DNA binding protein
MDRADNIDSATSDSESRRRHVKQSRSEEPGRRFLTVTETARMLGTSDMTLYRAINAGQFPAVRIRGRLIVPMQAIDEIVCAALNGRQLVDTWAWSAGDAQ